MENNTISSGGFVRHLPGLLFWSDETGWSIVSTSAPKNEGNATISDISSSDGDSIGFIVIICVIIMCLLIGIAFAFIQDRYPRNCDNLEAAIPTTPGDIEECHIERVRVERQLWYQYYLQPYTSVLTTKEVHISERASESSCSLSPDRAIDLLQQLEKEKEEDQELSTHGKEVTNGADVSDEDVPASKMVKHDASLRRSILRILDPVDSRYKRIDDHCAICINEYKVGEKVVHSAIESGDKTSRCPHVFHYSCMLSWLSHNGKKRCPTCRVWYVPGLVVKEQMKAANISVSGCHLVDSQGVILSTVTETSLYDRPEGEMSA